MPWAGHEQGDRAAVRLSRVADTAAVYGLRPSTRSGRELAAREHAAARRAWLALYFPRLPLEAMHRGLSVAGLHGLSPTVVVNGKNVQTQVVCVSASAEQAGIKPGMSASAASARVEALHILRQDRALEQNALEGLAVWSGQFSPVASLQAGCGLLIEIGASLRLFGGQAVLLERMSNELRDLGFVAMPGVAPTPGAAWLLARYADPRPVGQLSRLASRLAPLPMHLLELDPSTLDALHGMGLRTLGDCVRLPRDGFARRFGPKLLEQLDKALGKRPDPRLYFKPPENFVRRLSFNHRVDNTAALLVALRQLLLELSGFLRRRAMQVQGLELHLAHEVGPATRLVINLVRASADVEHLHALVRERLGRLNLAAPVIYLAMAAHGIVISVPRNGDLFAPQNESEDAWEVLVERLSARLGSAAVRGIAGVAEYRPERAYSPVIPGQTSIPIPSALRPTWLLGEPTPLTQVDGHPHHGGHLRLLDGPERIASGWWDEADIMRDYYVAASPDGARYWIYRELRGARGWYLHGIFA